MEQFGIAAAPIGRVVATKDKPSTAYEFYFWTSDQDPKVGIGTLVVADGGRSTAYGVVVEGIGFTDLESALHEYIGCEGSPESEFATIRPEVRCYKASVLRVEPEEPLQPVPVGPVYLADEYAINIALRMDAFREKTGIPIGLYQNGDDLSPICLDSEFLIGPEAAHMNLTGVSGLATKTSSIEFALLSIFQHFGGRENDGVAAVCFNVKGPDMLFLDFPARVPTHDPRAETYKVHGLLSDDPEEEKRLGVENEMYEKLNIPCEPFAHVEYYAPFKTNWRDLNTLRNNDQLASTVKPLAWGLSDVLKYTEVVLNKDDVDAKADAFIEYIKERVVNQSSKVNGQDITVTNFQDLERWFVLLFAEIDEPDRRSEYWGSHHVATIRKVRNRLTNLSTRYAGLISPTEFSSDLDWGNFKDRHVYVVDVANLDGDAQDLVFTRVITELREQMEKGALGVKNVIVVVDELNKYAPSDGPDTYLRKMLLDISERGRYLGLVLFSAQQFRSQVHKRIVGNSATCIYGRMDMDELATPGYQVLTHSTKEKLATLSKGQLMIRHPHFNQPIFVKFPRPNILRGQDGIKMFPPASDLPLDEAIWRNLLTVDKNISRNAVADLILGLDESDAVSAMLKTIQKRPDDAIAYFRQAIPVRAKAQWPSEMRQTLVSVAAPDPTDPFQD